MSAESLGANWEDKVDVQEGDRRNQDSADVEKAQTETPPAESGPTPADSTQAKFKLGQRVWGPILRLAEKHAVVSLSEHDLDEGILDMVHLRDEFGNLSVSEGDEVQAFIVALEPTIKLAPSLLPPASEVMKRLQEVMGRSETVRGRVLGVNRGGLEIDIDGRRAFCPYSHIELGRCDQPEIYVNHILDFSITELDESQKRIVVSRRSILEKEREKAHAKIRAQIKEGAEFDGVVTRIQPFGAFVDIGGVDGLVHVSEISYDRIDHPQDVLRSGEKVRVRVLGVSRDRQGKERIKLSIKATLEDPWTKIQSIIRTGDIITGAVVRVTDFGAFVKVYPGIEGLLHVSQYEPRRPAGTTQDPTPAAGEPAAPAEAAEKQSPHAEGRARGGRREAVAHAEDRARGGRREAVAHAEDRARGGRSEAVARAGSRAKGRR